MLFGATTVFRSSRSVFKNAAAARDGCPGARGGLERRATASLLCVRIQPQWTQVGPRVGVGVARLR